MLTKYIRVSEKANYEIQKLFDKAIKEAVTEALRPHDVVGRSEQCDHDYSDGTGTGWNVCKKCGDMYYLIGCTAYNGWAV